MQCTRNHRFASSALLLASLTLIVVCVTPAQQSGSSKTHLPAPIPIAQSKAEIILADSPTRVALSDTSSPDAPKVSLAAELETLEPGQRLSLILRDLHADAAPGTLFHLFLDLPEGVTPDLKARDPHLVGNFNFFNSVKPSSGSPSTADRKSFRSYDITSPLQKLQQSARLPGETTVTIIPSHAIAPNSRPVIGRIEIVLQSAPANPHK